MRSEGFSVVELLVATAATLVVVGAALAILSQAHAAFAAAPEAADSTQRLRAAAHALYSDLVASGSGPEGGALSGSLLQSFAPVLPFARGTRTDDPPGSFFADRITLVSVSPAAPHTRLAAGGLSIAPDWIGVERQPQCPPDSPLCAFVVGSPIAIADGVGNAEVLGLTAVDVTTATPLLQHANQPLAFSGYQPTNTEVIGVTNIVYLLNRATSQLEIVNGIGAPHAPLADNVVGLTFTYYGDPQPPQRTGVELDDPGGPWTTYGPKPPPLDVQANPAWPPGENCVFAAAGAAHVPRLGVLDGGPLVALSAAQLTDGPWCPDSFSPARWDADLLRIRAVGLTIRVQAAIAALRGPAGTLFAFAGTGRESSRWVADREVAFQVSPRNMNLRSIP